MAALSSVGENAGAAAVERAAAFPPRTRISETPEALTPNGKSLMIRACQLFDKHGYGGEYDRTQAFMDQPFALAIQLFFKYGSDDDLQNSVILPYLARQGNYDLLLAPPAFRPQTMVFIASQELILWPRSLFSETCLTTLYAQNNFFTSIPEAIATLKYLTSIDLSKNQITSIPENFVNLRKLESINLSDNQLTSIPDCLASLPKLRAINLLGNQFSREERARIHKLFSDTYISLTLEFDEDLGEPEAHPDLADALAAFQAERAPT